MSSKIFLMTILLLGFTNANRVEPKKKSDSIDKSEAINEMRALCDRSTNSFACIKYKAMDFLDSLFKKENFHITNDIEVRANDLKDNEFTGRAENDIFSNIEHYLRGHDIIYSIPMVNAKLKFSSRNLDSDELDLKIKLFETEGRSEVEARKSKLRKILTPILVVILLKAMTLIPLAIGILGLKAFNALQLGFFSFVISVGLAIFHLCKKVTFGIPHAHHVAAHGVWDGRGYKQPSSEDFDAQNLAYRAY